MQQRERRGGWRTTAGPHFCGPFRYGPACLRGRSARAELPVQTGGLGPRFPRLFRIRLRQVRAPATLRKCHICRARRRPQTVTHCKWKCPEGKQVTGPARAPHINTPFPHHWPTLSHTPRVTHQSPRAAAPLIRITTPSVPYINPAALPLWQPQITVAALPPQHPRRSTPLPQPHPRETSHPLPHVSP